MMNSLEARKNIEGALFLLLFCLTIPAANWMVAHVGSNCSPGGTCLLPVAPGLMAPSGSPLIGAALVLRNLVQRRLGIEFGIAAIFAGAGLSAGLAPPSLVLASAVAFLVSECVNFAVYTALARRQPVTAIVAATTIGLAVDSVVFLSLAFGSLYFLPGQVVGKGWVVLLSVPLIAYLRRRDERLGLTPA